MTTLTNAVPPAVVQGRDERLSDLASDLRAAGGFEEDGAALDALMRPSILRRVAALLASNVRPGTDRVACTELDAPIGVAVALHTGVPLVIVQDGEPVTGELHRTESVVAVAFSDDSLGEVERTIRSAGATLAAAAAVIGAGHADEERSTLFRAARR